MDALKLKTVDDLLAYPEERVELIDGEIVRRPMARFEHAAVQSALSDEVLPFKRQGGPSGWWIVPEIGVRYSLHQCPSHDLAGWRKERVPERPSGVLGERPDWVCEILSPGHERKDLVHHVLLLQRAGVPHYWVISPEDRTLIAYALERGAYRVSFAAEPPEAGAWGRVRIPPFDAVEIDLAYLFGAVTAAP